MLPIDSAEVLSRFHEELGLVTIVARSLHRRLGSAVEFDDLMSAGREGLLEAARRFDPECGTPFRAFARFRVRGAMIDCARRHSPFSRKIHRQLVAQKAALNFRESSVTAPVPVSEGSTISILANIATATALGLELDASGEPSSETVSPEQALARRELVALVKDTVDELGADEAQIIRRHYFQEEYLEDIAADLGMSKAWATRLHAKAIARLVKLLRDER